MTAKVTVVDERAGVRSAVAKATITSLSHAAGYIRKVAVNSIRVARRPSSPGQPPHSARGVLKHGIAYAVDQGGQSAVIGPTKSALGLIGQTHEFGGPEQPKSPSQRTKRFNLVLGGFGPVRNLSAAGAGGRSVPSRPWKQGDKLVVVELRTDRQVEAARALAAQIPPSQGGPPSTKVRRYPARPFMGPALNRSIPRLPSFWANSIKGG